MSTTLDFSKLDLKDALDLAILVEEEAKDRYDELTAQLERHHTPEAADFFRFMARNEFKHGEELRQRRKELFGEAPCGVDRSMLFDVEAPEYENVRAFMSPREAFEVAMEAEKKAWTFFDEALGHLEDADVIALFEELRQEEVEHQRLVQEQIDRLPPDSEVSQGDFADEPVGL